jgi:hypothetical protein
MKNLIKTKISLLPINLQLFADEQNVDSFVGSENNANEGQAGVVDLQNDIGTKDSVRNRKAGNDFKKVSISGKGNDSVDDWYFPEDDAIVKDDSNSDQNTQKSNDEDDIDTDEMEYDDEGSKDGEVADTRAKMTPEENKVYQKIRQRAEAEGRASLEKEKTELESKKSTLDKQIQQLQEMEIKNKHFAAITDTKIEELAYEKGFSLDAAKEILVRDAQIAATFEINNMQQRQEINRLKKDQLRNEKYFKFIEPMLEKALNNDPNLDVNGAYNYFLGEYVRNNKSIDNMIRDEKRNTQQQTVADIQDRNRRRNVSGSSGRSDSVVDAGLVLDSVSMQMTKTFGHDAKDIANYVKKNLKKR